MTLLSGVFLTEQSFPLGAELPSRIAVALPRAYEAGAVPVIASIIFLALIVAAVGGGGLILARRLRLLLDIAAASFLLDAVAALTVSAIS